jgi:hypothetical protein
MTVYHGATVALKIENILAEGKILKQYIGTLDGSAGNQVLLTPSFPITTNAGVTTDDETLVEVYTDGLVPGTFNVYDTDGSDYTIDGATGAVTIQAAENQVGNAGERISISYWTSALVSRGQGASIDFERDIEVIHELGNPAPQELASGHYKVSGNIDVLYITRDIFGKVIGESDFYKQLASYSFYLLPAGVGGGNPYIKVAGAKFHGASFKATLKGILALNVKYSGLVASIGTL